MSADWHALREKHRAFWTRTPVETPIIGNKRTTAFVLGDYQFTVTDRPLKPEDIDLARVLEWAEALYRRGDGFLDGELVWGLPPLPGVPWLEAILGCPIWVSQESRSLWAAPWLDNWDEVEHALPLSANPWFLKLLELTDALVQQANGHYPITQTLMRGPADLAVALRGHERFCFDLFDHPEPSRRLVERCTDIWIEVARVQLARIPPFDGGYTPPRLEVWAPGQAIRFEEDATILFSPQVYRTFFQECDRRIASSFEYALMHTHSANHKLVTRLLEIDELHALQVLLDPNGPSLDEMVRLLQKIQVRGKALLITHELPDDVLASVVHQLSPRGLALERMISV
jgi:hypothetical protein